MVEMEYSEKYKKRREEREHKKQKHRAPDRLDTFVYTNYSTGLTVTRKITDEMVGH